MAIVAGYDVHRNQIAFDALDTESGELRRGRIEATPAAVVRAWVGRFPGEDVQVAVEACTGWLFVCRALAEAGASAHLADPESWIPLEHVRQWRSRCRLRKTLVDERCAWQQRIQATLFQHGVPAGAVCARLRSAAAARSPRWRCPPTHASGSRSRWR